MAVDSVPIATGPAARREALRIEQRIAFLRWAASFARKAQAYVTHRAAVRLAGTAKTVALANRIREVRRAANSSKTRLAGESHGEKRGRQRPAGNSSLQSADKPTTTNSSPQARSPRASERRYGDLNDRDSQSGKAETSTAVNAEESSRSDPETNQTEVNVNVATKPKKKPRSLAETRGVNWGLPPAARASNPITRPIHIQCEGDKLLLRPEISSDPPVVVPLRMRTEDSVDPLVEAIQARIRDWGIAGRGVYWRPQLVLEVGHSGEGRFADLEALLADSGFDVKRRE